jgi:hypothetical protein
VRSEAPKKIVLSNNSIYVDADGYTHIVEKQFINQGKKQIQNKMMDYYLNKNDKKA